MKHPDVDIDTPRSFDPRSIFPWTRASLVQGGELRPHNCGVHPQRVPVDQLTGLSAIPYTEADALGYAKIDFLHLQLLDNFQSRAEIEELLKVEPDWGLLLVPEVQKKLFQLSNHGDVLNAVRPKSVEELSDVLALIRPGKRQLLKLYLAQREITRRALYAKDESGYSFKRSHSVAYALNIVLQLHLIDAGII